MQQTGAANVDAITMDEAAAGDKRLDRARLREIGVEQEAVHERRMAPPERLVQMQRDGTLGRKTKQGFYSYE